MSHDRPVRRRTSAVVVHAAATLLLTTLAVDTVLGAGLTPSDRARAARQAARDVYGLNSVSPTSGSKVAGPLAAIGYDLALLHYEYQAFLAGGGSPNSGPAFLPTNNLIHHADGFVVVDAVARRDGNELMSAMADQGMRDGAAYDLMVSGRVPILALPAVAALPTLHSARPAYMVTNVGLVDSQGDAAMRADVARLNFGVDGTGVMVGTLSDSYDDLGGAAADVASGDLPGGIVVLEDDATGVNTDEGRAMMQIIADVAPGADQAFHTAFKGQANFAQGIVDLALAGCNVINDDVIYLTEPFFSDGVIARVCDLVRAFGRTYFSAALNYARQSYEDGFRTTGVFGPTYDGHDFDPGAGVDVLQQITIAAGGDLSVSLQWDQPYFQVSGAPGCANDIDIFLLDAAGTSVLASSIAFNVGGDPIEFLTFTNGGPAGTFNLVIAKFLPAGGPNPGLIKTVVVGATIDEYATNSPTSFGHPNAAGTIGTAAAFFDDTPVFGQDPPLAEDFSSVGGVPILFDLSGNPVNIVRQRPLITAPDGVDNTFFGSDIGDPGTFGNFFGTSAAAPHAAGVAALLLDFNGAFTPAQMENALTSTALDMDDPFTGGFDTGFDFKSGFGLIQADRALCVFDVTPPTVSCDLTSAGPVDASCERVINFSMSAVDDHGMNLTDLSFDLTIQGGGGSLRSVQSNGSQVDVHTATRTGSAVVEDLTGCSVTVRLEVQARDACGLLGTICTKEIIVTDETAPALTCPSNITVECSDHCGTPRTDPQLTAFFATVSATDNCDADVALADDAPSCFPVGATIVTFTATDNCGLQTTCQRTVTVVDTTPPVITTVLNRYSLWPPNHKLVSIHSTITVVDICDPNPTFVLTSITSDELDEGLGDGDFPDDIQNEALNTPDTDFKLRAERSGLGDGRVYTIVYTATDASGNTATSTSEVEVPHDQGGAALSSLGFASDGGEFESGATRFALVIPSLPASDTTPAFDAGSVVTREAYVGNTAGAIRPLERWQVDVDDDGDVDAVFFYDVQSASEIRVQSDVVDGPLALHYTADGGAQYIVPDIFALGAPIPLEGHGPGTVDVQEPVAQIDLPSETRLLGAYPNPFRPSVTIQLALARPERVELSVYDARGARVRTLVSGERPAGTHAFLWDGRSEGGNPVATGVYFARVTAGGFHATERIVKLR